MPIFMKFSGEGVIDNNPSQHIAHFRAACGNTGGDNIFLLRQFSQSLTGAAFDWYCSLEDDSIKSWDEMVEAFLDKFAVIIERVTIADLATLKPNKDESISNFIGRWKNMYVKCDTQIDEEDAVAMILRNIDNWMVPFLSVTNVTTLQQLMQYVNRLQARPPPGATTGSNFNRFQKGGGRADTRTVNTANKGQNNKQSNAEVANTENKNGDSRPTYGDENKRNVSLAERKNKLYSFRRDKVAKLFRDALKDNLPLPECKRPEDASKSDQPNYCPYHRILGHTIEDCYVFKDYIERRYKKGEIILPESVLQDPAPHAQVNMVCHEVPALHAFESPDESGGSWSIHMSKKTRKMVKALQKVPGVTWADESTPILIKGKAQSRPLKPQIQQEKETSKKIVGRASCNPIVHQVIRDDDPENDHDLNGFFEGESSCARAETAENNVVLRSGVQIPDRQPPKEKVHDKKKGKDKEADGVPNKTDKLKGVAGDYNVLAHLRKIPALLSVFDALMMPQELREVLVNVLLNPEQHHSYFTERSLEEANYINNRAS